MSQSDVVRDHLNALSELVGAVTESMSGDIEEMAEETMSVLRQGGRIFFCGNGGSAADAQHLAAEYVVRFQRERAPLPALALTTDSAVVTAGGNDYGFDTIFARQVEAFARSGDLLFLHSTSGDSENLLRAAEVARDLGVRTVALLAKGGGRLKDAVDRALVVPTRSTARAQELHLTIGHIVCDLVDRAFAEEGT
jgi:D-sedoheptulose 7-phosphate isomerase